MEDVQLEPVAAESNSEGSVEDLAIVRELARKANADAIPELIDGSSVTEIMASVDAAREAYARVFADVSKQSHHVAPRVPAGGSAGGGIDIERLPASEKLRIGVGAAKR